jgi:pimeloyl-ACP methyl ester carboxylesterase
MFAEGEPRAQYAEMQQLLTHGKRTGWGAEFLADTDVARSAEDISNLWVRRFNYDPREDLKKVRVPFLAFYGGSDRVVPPAENEPELRRLLDAAGNKNFRIVVLPGAGHGLVQDEGLRRLAGARGERETYYWKFGRLGATYLQEMVDFLQANLKIGNQTRRAR